MVLSHTHYYNKLSKMVSCNSKLICTKNRKRGKDSKYGNIPIILSRTIQTLSFLTLFYWQSEHFTWYFIRYKGLIIQIEIYLEIFKKTSFIHLK